MNKVAFLKCGELGLYPIVETSAWVEQLATYGVSAIQLRMKNKTLNEVEHEIIKCIKIAKQYNLKLFINDYWELAIKYQAYGIHLGQDDLLEANLQLIKEHNIRLGISTCNHSELNIAKSINPSYIALGPIFPTTSKIITCQAQGVERIGEWQRLINCPLVVIGGIGLDNIEQVIAAGAKNIAMISAITKAENPEQITRLFLHKIASHQ